MQESASMVRWEERRSASGRVHCVRHTMRTRQWVRPARQQQNVVSPNTVETGPTSLSTSPTSSPATSPFNPSSSDGSSRDSSSNTSSSSSQTSSQTSSNTATATQPSSSHTSTATHHFVRRRSSRLRNYLSRAQLHDIVELPDGYEQRTTQQGQVYFPHTRTGVSTWHDPRVPRQTGKEDDRPLQPKFMRDLVHKMRVLKQEFQSLQPQTGHCRIEVSREEIFEDSYQEVMKMRSKDLRKRLMVKFHGEEGLDYGGVAREWFHMLSHEMLNPCYGLFQYSREDIYTLQINPDSGVNPDHLSYFHFVGRVIGMAVFHGHYLDGGFTMPFYKQLLVKQVTLEDLESVDPEMHRSLCWMLENSIENVLDNTFSVEHNSFGKVHKYELKPGGSEIKITDDNKQEYVKLYVQWRFMRGIEAQFLALQKGFSEMIPQHLLRTFDERELELMIEGLGKIDLDDWKKHTCLKQCSWDSNIVLWFWRAVESFNDEMKARMLQFVTGSSRVPLQGFKALQGSTRAAGPQLFTIHQVDISTDNLPTAHTCFNRLDIPPYESYEKLLAKLTCAVEETSGFAVE